MARRENTPSEASVVPCPACDRPMLLLADETLEDRRTCATCDEVVRRVVRAVLSNRERNRRWRAKRRSCAGLRANASADASVSTPIVVIRRHVHGAADLTGFRDRTEPPERVPALPSEGPGDRYCACGRSLNLGRHKTEGDTCGQCKREEQRAKRVQPPMYASFEELAAQLEDETPLDDDPYTARKDGTDG